MVKSPINWVGNKIKHIETIQDLVSNKHYDCVYDLFLGSGNILLNLNCGKKYVGLDKVKLIPMFYTALKEQSDFCYDELQSIVESNNKFSCKEDYYAFREYWNKKYANDQFDRKFLYETVLLLKMCSNSMVRFNRKGQFNQGFRGVAEGNEFFTESMKSLCVNGLNEISELLRAKNIKFFVGDFMNRQPKEGNNLLILDPPYILRQDMYDMNFTEKHDEALLNMIANTKNSFIYFNYLSRGNEKNIRLEKFIAGHNLKIIEINNKSLSGQGRKNASSVKEVIVTNIE